MHVLIVGMTDSGKTTLAKLILQKQKSRGTPSIVLDVLCDPTWNADFQTDIQRDFLTVMRQSRSCALFVDESGAAIGRYAGEMMQVATQSRHFGHKAHFITQRASQLDRTVRDQCSELYVFRVGEYDAKMLSEEYGFKILKDAVKLPQGCCFKVTRFSEPEFLDIFGQGRTLENMGKLKISKESQKLIDERENS